MSQVKAKVARKRKVEAPQLEAPQVEGAVEDKAKLAKAEPPRVHEGSAPSSFRVSNSLTPLRHDYKAKGMTNTDDAFLRDCISFADGDGRFPRLNADAGRLGRLYSLGFVQYDVIGIFDRDQTITLTPKAAEWVKPVRAAPAA